MSEEVTEDSVKEAVKETRASFDLGAFVKSRKLRETTIKIYTDEETGDALGGVEPEKNGLGVTVGTSRWGVLGEIDKAISNDPDADISELRQKAIDLRMDMEASALTFHLRAVPEVVVKDARRKSRKAHADGSGKVPDSKAADFVSTFNARMLSSTIAKVVNADGAENGRLSVEAAAELEDYLPPSEYDRLIGAQNSIQFKQAIGDNSLEDSDF